MGQDIRILPRPIDKRTMTYSTIELIYEAALATITLNRPEKRNAISFELISDLMRALDGVARSSARVLIVTGAGKAFCSGMDLENLKALIGRSPEQSLEDSRTMVRLFRTIYEFPKVTIAAVNGAAIAGGTGLALLSDFTLAVPEAKFGYTEVRIGFVPAIVSTFLLRQVGEKHARDLLLTGRLFDAHEALYTKRLLTEHARAELDAQIESAVRENAAIRQTADFREGVTSFLEKRKPRWSGE